jgi:thymidylate synthase
MIVYSGQSLAEVYRKSLKDLYENPDYSSSPRGLQIKENIGVTLEIENPMLSLYSNERRGSQKKYIAAELIWYFSGRNDVEFISEYASFWNSIKNQDGTANSAYGNLIFSKKNIFGINQYEWAIKSLTEDADSRQAIMHFNLPEHQYDGNKDFVCTMYGIWHIRDSRLNLTIHMRSNDAILGTPTDISFFSVLQQQALLHLKQTHPDLKLGKYTHIVDSYHIYERNFNLVEEMLQHDFKPESMPRVDANLIHQNGAASDDFEIMCRNLSIQSEDSMYRWITENLKK